MKGWITPICWLVVAAYLLIAGGVWLGLWGSTFDVAGGPRWGPADGQYWFGTNLIGQDIFSRALVAIATAVQTGLLVAVAATLLGAFCGAIAGYWQGRWPDSVLLWLMGVVDSVPFVLLAAAIAYAMGAEFAAVLLAMVVTLWVPVARLIRAEVYKLRTLPYVDSAILMGLSPLTIIVRHVLPNTAHLLLAQGLLVMVAALKAEVVLSFLGIGSLDSVSWGIMIAESTQELLTGRLNNLLAASLPMFVLVFVLGTLAEQVPDRPVAHPSGPVQA